MKFPLTYIAFVVVGVLFLTGVIPHEASAAGWGRGTFTGQVKGQFGPRPASKIVLSAKGGKVRIRSLRLQLKCTDDNGLGLPVRYHPLVHSKSVRVKEGAAGGGAILKFRATERFEGRKFAIRIEVFLGLRDSKIDGTVDADISTDLPVCFDSGAFTARR